MKIILIGAGGTIGKFVRSALEEANCQVLAVGKTTGDFQVDLDHPDSIDQLYRNTRPFDAVVCTAGHVAFGKLGELKNEHWEQSLTSKLMGQINLVRQALPYINDGGSFTLISGIVGDEQIAGGTIAATINSAIGGFVRAAACELQRGLRINVVSPTLLTESRARYDAFFPGFITVDGIEVGLAFKKAVLGVQTGQIVSAR